MKNLLFHNSEEQFSGQTEELLESFWRKVYYFSAWDGILLFTGVLGF